MSTEGLTPKPIPSNVLADNIFTKFLPYLPGPGPGPGPGYGKQGAEATPFKEALTLTEQSALARPPRVRASLNLPPKSLSLFTLVRL